MISVFLKILEKKVKKSIFVCSKYNWSKMRFRPNTLQGDRKSDRKFGNSIEKDGCFKKKKTYFQHCSKIENYLKNARNLEKWKYLKNKICPKNILKCPKSRKSSKDRRFWCQKNAQKLISQKIEKNQKQKKSKFFNSEK